MLDRDDHVTQRKHLTMNSPWASALPAHLQDARNTNEAALA